MMIELDENYWQNRYAKGDIPWDIGAVSPPMRAYIDKLEQKDARILIPGAGRAYEAIYLFEKGFKNVFVVDWAMSAFDHLRAALPSFPLENLRCTDFFELQEPFDLILEQTFFCAILPSKRRAYMAKVASLLPKGGTLAGLLFASHFAKEGPPFGGTKLEYEALFNPDFHISKLELAENSISPRMNNELFFELIKK